jgi:3-hydroxybutyryl-CoA dehydratase
MTENSPRNDFIVGEKASLTRTISEADIQRMAEIIGDYNPIHMDEDFARRTRFKGRIAHGVFSSGLISAVLGTKLPGQGCVYLRQTLDFLYPVRPGDMLTAEVEVTSWQADKRIINLKTWCVNQDGTKVVDGEAVLLVDKI